jgi:hypothetical protein
MLPYWSHHVASGFIEIVRASLKKQVETPQAPRARSTDSIETRDQGAVRSRKAA